MNNADRFKEVFGIYATEMWSMPEKLFLEWLNDEYEIEIEGGSTDEDMVTRA